MIELSTLVFPGAVAAPRPGSPLATTSDFALALAEIVGPAAPGVAMPGRQGLAGDGKGLPPAGPALPSTAGGNTPVLSDELVAPTVEVVAADDAPLPPAAIGRVMPSPITFVLPPSRKPAFPTRADPPAEAPPEGPEEPIARSLDTAVTPQVVKSLAPVVERPSPETPVPTIAVAVDTPPVAADPVVPPRARTGRVAAARPAAASTPVRGPEAAPQTRVAGVTPPSGSPLEAVAAGSFPAVESGAAAAITPAPADEALGAAVAIPGSTAIAVPVADRAEAPRRGAAPATGTTAQPLPHVAVASPGAAPAEPAAPIPLRRTAAPQAVAVPAPQPQSRAAAPGTAASPAPGTSPPPAKAAPAVVMPQPRSARPMPDIASPIAATIAAPDDRAARAAAPPAGVVAGRPAEPIRRQDAAVTDGSLARPAPAATLATLTKSDIPLAQAAPRVTPAGAADPALIAPAASASLSTAPAIASSGAPAVSAPLEVQPVARPAAILPVRAAAESPAVTTTFHPQLSVAALAAVPAADPAVPSRSDRPIPFARDEAGPAVVTQPGVAGPARRVPAADLRATTRPDAAVPLARVEAVAAVAPQAGVAAERVPAAIPAPVAPLASVPPGRDPAPASSGIAPVVVTVAPATPVTPPPQPVAQPAAQAFAAAMFAAERPARRERSEAPVEAGVLPTAPLAPAQPPAAPVAVDPRAPIDLGRDDWMGTMIERIETLRSDGGARETRLRLAPDALGTVDVSISHDAEGAVRIHIVAESPQARAILADAAPRLAEMAEARGLKLGGGGAEAGTGGDAGQRDAQRSAAPAAPLHAPAANDDLDPSTDSRIA